MQIAYQGCAAQI